MKASKMAVLAVLSVFLLSTIPVPVAAQEELVERDRALREKYLEQKDAYLKAKRTYLDARKEWLTVKSRFVTRDPLVLRKAQNFLDKGTKHLIHYLNLLSRKVEATRALSDERQAALTTELAGYIATLEADQAEINNATTVEQLRAAAQKTKADWDTIRPQVKRIIGEVLLAKAERIVARAENASVRVDAKIADLKAAGKDTARLEEFSADFKTKLAVARDKLASAAAKLAEVKTGDATLSLRTADQWIREANRTLRELHRELGQIVREIRFQETGEAGAAPTEVTAPEPTETPVAPEEAENVTAAETTVGGTSG